MILLALIISILYIIGIRPYVVQTGSMEPTIPVASICFVNHHADFASLQIGDIVAFRIGENTLVTHRISGKSEEGFITKGDANEIEDNAPMTAENFVGKNIFHIPKAGILFFYLKTLWGKIAFVSFSLFLLFIGHMMDNPKPPEKEGDSCEK